VKTKLFIAFCTVIIAALLSHIFFERAILSDFDAYVEGVRDDQLRWIISSLEECYHDGAWDKKALSESIHWAMMLGLHVKVLSPDGATVMSSREVMDTLSDTMKHRMEGLLDIPHEAGGFQEHALMHRQERIGTLLAHHFGKRELLEKEERFKKRTAQFFYITISIAGGGLLVLAWLFSQYLSKPLTQLQQAAEEIGKGGFDVRITHTSRDEVGKLSESFAKMADSLKREHELRTRLMSNVAHELRTPLTIMKAHVEALSDGVVDAKEGIENVRGEIERLIRLVKGIEDMTTAEASFFVKAETDEVSLPEFLSSLITEMQPIFHEKGLTLEVERGQDIAVRIDAEKVERIVRNLLSNALKFTEKGGAVVTYGADDKRLLIEIEDTGRGIPPQEAPYIFDRFYKGPAERSAGLGLGLAIAKELAAVLGGTIAVSSEEGKGSRFTVTLPRIPVRKPA
jgi:two-component system sensor histidine kinase BaeS